MQNSRPPRKKPAGRRRRPGVPPAASAAPPSASPGTPSPSEGPGRLPQPDPDAGRSAVAPPPSRAGKGAGGLGRPPSATESRSSTGDGSPLDRRIGWESLAAVGILFLAAGLRLFDLGTQPLQPGEAANAWESWSILRGSGGSASAGPLLIYGNVLVFLLFGASDATARLLPALAGSGLVALPLLLQRELGRIGSRVAMLLLAVSPTLVHHSRQAEPAILASGAAFAFIAWSVIAVRDRERRAVYAAAGSVALLLTAGPQACFAVAVLLAYLVLRSVAGRTRAPAAVRQAGTVASLWPDFAGADSVPAPLRQPSVLARAGLVAGGTYLVATTGLLTNLHGVQEGLVDGLETWLKSFGTPAGQPPLIYGAILAFYELPALVFGLLGAIYLARKGDLFAGLLTWWALAGFLLGAFGAERPAGLAPQLVVPLALLAGAFVGERAPDLSDPKFRVDLGWLALGGVILLAALGIALNHVSSPQPFVPDAILVLPLALMVAGLIVAVQSYGSKRTTRLLLTFAFLVLLALTWRANAILSYRSEANPTELLVGRATSTDVRAMSADAAAVVDALAINRLDQSVVVAPALRQPVLWYLRELRNVTVGDAAASPAIAVRQADDKAPRGSYAGQRYRVWSGSELDLGSWKEAWRWLAFREAPSPPLGVDAVVYVKGVPSR